MSQAVLEAVQLTKRFGGLAAVNLVSLTLNHNHLHAVIGPNGAGKTTLTHLLSGDLLPTEGQVLLNEKDVTRWSPEKLSHAGLERSYQKTNIFAPLTVWENVRLAAQSRFVQKSFYPQHWLGRALNNSQINDLAHSALEKTSLVHRRDAIAGATSHGEQRQLEIAMTLATQPQVLLLDEPLAGMGTAEAQRMIELLLELKKSHAMMLVEHDMDAVFALADQLTVMVNGQVIATGKPNDIRSDPLVQAAYLGETTS